MKYHTKWHTLCFYYYLGGQFVFQTHNSRARNSWASVERPVSYPNREEYCTWNPCLSSYPRLSKKVDETNVNYMGFKLNPPHPRILLFLSSTLCDCVCTCQMKVKVTQSCLTLCDPMDYIVHGILQTRILEWIANPFSREPSQPKDQTQTSCIAGGLFTSWATREMQHSEN